MRYQASSWRKWTRTRLRWCQWGTKRRPLAVADEVGLEPAGQAVLAGGAR